MRAIWTSLRHEGGAAMTASLIVPSSRHPLTVIALWSAFLVFCGLGLRDLELDLTGNSSLERSSGA
jgi:hypothetical protein